MRKYVIGGIAGFSLAFSLSAHAEEAVSLIGKTVQGAFPVKLNGQTLDKQAIIVDGTSFLPVRAMGEALGYDILFDPDMGITFKKLHSPPDAEQPVASDSSVPATGANPDDGYYRLTNIVFSLTVDDKTKTYKKSGNIEFIDVEGNQYISITSLSSVYTISWSDPLITISFNNLPVTAVSPGAQYVKDTSAFSYRGTTFVNLSTLGLHAAIEGDTLVVEESF